MGPPTLAEATTLRLRRPASHGWRAALIAMVVITPIVGCGTAPPADGAERQSSYAEEVVAIQQLLARYAHALDAGDGPGWAATFVEDGSFETVGEFRLQGRPEIAARMVNREPFVSRHLASNMVIDIDGDSAHMKAYLVVVTRGAISVTGNYEDVLRKENGEWLFVSRRFVRDPQPAARLPG